MRCRVLMVALFCAAGCQYDPDAALYVTSPPKEADIVGTYGFVRQAVDASASVGGHPSIVLRADHTCAVSDFPDWAAAGIAAYKLSGKITVSGTWKLDTVGGLGDGSGKEKHIYGIVLDVKGAVPTAKLTLDHGKRGLLFGYGDPDQGASMYFELGR